MEEKLLVLALKKIPSGGVCLLFAVPQHGEGGSGVAGGGGGASLVLCKCFHHSDSFVHCYLPSMWNLPQRKCWAHFANRMPSVL